MVEYIVEWFTALAISLTALGFAVQKMRGAWARKKANGKGPPPQHARAGDVLIAVQESSKRIDRVEKGQDALADTLRQHIQTEERNQRDTNEKLDAISAALKVGLR